MLGQKLAALLCSELKGTVTFQQRREDGGLWGTSSQGAGGRKGLVGGRGGVSLKDGEFVVRNKALPGSCCFSTSASECTFQSCSDSVFLLLLFYIVTKSREHKIYHLAVLQHTVHWYQIQSHCYAASSTIPAYSSLVSDTVTLLRSQQHHPSSGHFSSCTPEAPHLWNNDCPTKPLATIIRPPVSMHLTHLGISYEWDPTVFFF